MGKTLDYYLSLISPWSYLGGDRLAEIARRHRVEVRVKPVDYGVIFPQSGGLPLGKRAPQRRAYRLVELERWSRHLDLPLTLEPRYFPAPEGLAARLVLAAGLTNGDPLALSQAILRALWAEERNIAETGELLELAEETGHFGPALLARALDPETGFLYGQVTEEALAAGVFGAPSYVYEGEIFWGQDRLDFLERALS